METIFDKIKRFPRRAVRTAFIRTTSIDSEYEDTEKQCVIPERIIQTPEVNNMTFYRDAKALEKSFYCVPKGELVKLERVIYKTGGNILTTSSNEVLLKSVNADRSCLYPKTFCHSKSLETLKYRSSFSSIISNIGLYLFFKQSSIYCATPFLLIINQIN